MWGVGVAGVGEFAETPVLEAHCFLLFSSPLLDLLIWRFLGRSIVDSPD